MKTKKQITKEIKIKWSDYGESSLTIVAYLLKITKEKPAIPRDSSDFRRCIHLFECLGYKYHLKKLITEVSKVYPVWEGIAENWDKLMKLYNEEKDNRFAPRLYGFLKECREKK